MPPEVVLHTDRPNPLRLLHWKVPDVRHRYTARDTALYALSVGVGHKPHDERQIGLVDPWNPALAPLPTMALVLGYSGFWLGEAGVREATGISPAQVLHGEQWIELHQPLPARGEVIGRTRIAGLVDKGEGKGAFLYSERAITLAEGGAHIATCRQVHYLRGCGGFGNTGFMPPAPHPAPSGTCAMQVDLSTRPEQALLYRLNGDANRLHIDPAAALEAGLPRPIFHGMGSVGVVGHALVAGLLAYQPERLTSIRLRMTAPVYPGDTLRTEIWSDGSFRARVPERDVTVIDNGHATFT